MLTFFLSSQRRASVSILLIIIFYLLDVTFLKYITVFRNIFRPTLVHIFVCHLLIKFGMYMYSKGNWKLFFNIVLHERSADHLSASYFIENYMLYFKELEIKTQMSCWNVFIHQQVRRGQATLKVHCIFFHTNL